MSIKRPLEVTCQLCSAKQTVTVWETVNTILDPEMKAELIEQRVNVFECIGCGEPLTVDISFLYHDMERRFTVQYLNEIHTSSPEYYTNLLKDGSIAAKGREHEFVTKSTGEYLLHPHYVFSMQEMATYILFRDLCQEFGGQE